MRLNRTIALMLLFVQMGIMHPYLAYSAGETGGGKASGAGTKPAPPQEIALANSADTEIKTTRLAATENTGEDIANVQIKFRKKENLYIVNAITFKNEEMASDSC
jgi:hypothetical protein